MPLAADHPTTSLRSEGAQLHKSRCARGADAGCALRRGRQTGERVFVDDDVMAPASGGIASNSPTGVVDATQRTPRWIDAGHVRASTGQERNEKPGRSCLAAASAEGVPSSVQRLCFGLARCVAFRVREQQRSCVGAG